MWLLIFLYTKQAFNFRNQSGYGIIGVGSSNSNVAILQGANDKKSTWCRSHSPQLHEESISHSHSL